MRRSEARRRSVIHSEIEGHFGTAARIGSRDNIVGRGSYGRWRSRNDTRACALAQTRRKHGAHAIRGHGSSTACGAVRGDRHAFGINRSAWSVAESCRCLRHASAATTAAHEKSYFREIKSKPEIGTHLSPVNHCRRFRGNRGVGKARTFVHRNASAK